MLAFIVYFFKIKAKKRAPHQYMAYVNDFDFISHCLKPHSPLLCMWQVTNVSKIIKMEPVKVLIKQLNNCKFVIYQSALHCTTSTIISCLLGVGINQLKSLIAVKLINWRLHLSIANKKV